MKYGILRLFCIVCFGANTLPAAAATIISFPSVPHCVQKGRFKSEDCTLAFYAARRIYSERVPTFPTRDACTRIYKTCVIYNTFPVARRLDPRRLRYAPPFLGISVGSGQSLEAVSALVGVERQGINIGVTSRFRAPKPALGYFEPPPSAYRPPPAEQSTQTEPSVVVDGTLFSEPLPGQVLTYPVPKHLLPKRINDSR